MAQEISKKVVDSVTIALNKKEGEVTPESNFKNDLGADSIDMLEVIIQIEKNCGVRFENEKEFIGIKTVRDIVSLVEKKIF